MRTDPEISSYVVHSWNCDHFGHLNTRHHAAAFDDAIFCFWSFIGRNDAASIPVSVEIKTSFLHEAKAGMVTSIAAHISKIGRKSVGLTFEMRDRADGTLLAKCDVVEVFIDARTRASCPIPSEILLNLGQWPVMAQSLE